MSKRGYTHVKELLPAIQGMIGQGMSQQEVATANQPRHYKNTNSISHAISVVTLHFGDILRLEEIALCISNCAIERPLKCMIAEFRVDSSFYKTIQKRIKR